MVRRVYVRLNTHNNKINKFRYSHQLITFNRAIGVSTQVQQFGFLP